MAKHCKAALSVSVAVATALVGQIAQASTWTQLSLGTMPLATYSSAKPNNTLALGANLLPIMPYWNITTSDEHIVFTFEFSLLTDAHHSSGDSVNPGNHIDNYSNSAGTWSTVDDYVHGLYTDGFSMFAWTEQDTTVTPCTTGYCQLWQGTLGGSLSTEVDNGLYVTSFVADNESSVTDTGNPLWYATTSGSCGGNTNIPKGRCGATCTVTSGSSCSLVANTGTSEWGAEMVTLDRFNGHYVGTQFYRDVYVLDTDSRVWLQKTASGTISWDPMENCVCNESNTCSTTTVGFAQIAAKDGVVFGIVPGTGTDDGGTVYYDSYQASGNDCWTALGTKADFITVASDDIDNGADVYIYASDSSGDVWYATVP
jgi:hypothetical protein